MVLRREGLNFARELSLENYKDSFLCLQMGLLHSVSYFFFLITIPFFLLTFNAISPNIDKVLSISPSANEFAIEDLNVHHID